MPTANGINGHSNGDLTNGNAEIPVTKLLASFVANASHDQLTPAIREKVKEVVIDYIGVVVGAIDNADSSQPIYNAIVALQGQGNSGKCTVLAKGQPHMLPQYAGLINSTFGHSMDFDDTHTESTLHAGVTSISAAMTQAEVLGAKASIDDFMLAVSVGYEIICRIGRELGFFSYDKGFHNTGIAGIFGAVAAISVLKKLPASTIEMAFGLAGSKAAGSMQYLDNGSWNKRLHPGFAVHDAFMCISLAEAGVIGATRIIEGKMGFLQAYSPNPHKDMRRLTDGLGTDWIWLESSLKPYPACRMTHGFIEMSGNHGTNRGGKVLASDVNAITLTMSPSCFKLIGDPTPNKIHPNNVIDGQFSAYFQVANALVYGSATGLRAYQRLDDKDIYALSDKITVKIDPKMGGFAAHMAVEWADGTHEEKLQVHPLGEKQHPFTRDKVDEKFMSLAGPMYGKRKANEIIKTIDRIEQHSIEDLLVLLR
jgi:2-methylcitrate dehydratase PrpD